VTQQRFTGLVVRYVHDRGAHPCNGLAFYAPIDIFEEMRPLAYIAGAMARRIGDDRHIPCSTCERAVTRGDLSTEVSSVPQVYVAPERRTKMRGRALKPLVETHGPVSLGQIAEASGISRDKLRDLCEGGQVKGAYRHHGTRGEWRLRMADARRFLAEVNGSSATEAAERSADVQRVGPTH
jgi:hypothetical protein